MADTAVQHQDEHERRDVSRRGLVIFAAIFVALVMVSITALWLIFGTREGNFAAA